MTSIREVASFDVILEVKLTGSPLENPCAAARYKRMVTSSKNLSTQVGAILVLPLELVRRPERAGFSGVLAHEEFGPRLSVGAAWRAGGGLDEDVETPFQVPRHDEGQPVYRW